MELHFYTPENSELKKYIEGYYFLSDSDCIANKEYLTFPNNYCIVTTNFNSLVKLEADKISISPSPSNNIYASFAYNYLHPIKVYYTKPCREITIYFKPLGINYFVDNLETMFVQKKITEFIPQFSDFKEEMNKIFLLEKRSVQIEALETYWLSKLMKRDLIWVRIIIADIESNMRIEDIAKKHHISRKHLNHFVQKNLGKSAVEYRKIFRFRKAITNRKASQSLTELSYKNLFFDQSHLIKDFKSLTKINPKVFFQNVNTENKNVWLFKRW